MSVAPGQTLLHYRLVEKIGEGGMGVVWKATDTTLERSVAIKILPEAFAADDERLARFEREARLLASLNHPHIATVHGLHDVPSASSETALRFLAMELAEGEDLARRLSRGPLPADEALEIAAQVAGALEAAHDSGVIHRDLKPANIVLAADGQAKVLDFGLAKALSPEVSGEASVSMSPTVTSAGTLAGGILGTTAYMSPEQARGKAVDRRTDVWAFGCVLYEMLTARRAFAGESISDTVAAVLKEDPDWTALRGNTAQAVQPLLERCLRKDARRRPHHVADVRIELEDIASGSSSATFAGHATPVERMPRWGLFTIGGLALAAVLMAFLWIGGTTQRGDVAGAAPSVTFSQQTYYAGVESFPALSPDGNFIAYSAAPDGGAPDIFLERVGGRNPINLTADSDARDTMPAFSPDGRFIAFRSFRGDGGIFVMGATGESVRRLTDDGFDPAWSPDGARLAVASEGSFDPLGRNRISSLSIVDVETGETREVFAGDAMQPSWSPHGHRIACWTAYAGRADSGQRDVFTILPDGTDPVAVTNDVDVDWSPVWSGDGRHLYFASDRGGSMNIWRVPIDEKTGRTFGEPEAIPTPSRWSGPLAVSGGGLLAYVAAESRSNISRMPYDPESGKITGPPETVTGGTLFVASFNVSPDGEWIVFRGGVQQEDLYLVRPDGTGLRKLTDDRDKDRGPSWTPDGRAIVFYSNRGDKYEIWSIERDGSGLKQLTRTPGDSVWFPRISPDGERLTGFNAEGTWVVDLVEHELAEPNAENKLPPIDEENSGFRGTTWSPDGRHIGGFAGGRPVFAFYRVEAGEYLLVDTPNGEPGRILGWLPDGRAVVEADGDTFVLALDSGSITPLAEPPYPLPDAGSYSPSPDGKWLYFRVGSTEADIWIAEID